MFKPKIVVMMALMVFATGILLVGDAVAGEYVKVRNANHNVKWQQIDVGDLDGHVIAIGEVKGVTTNLERKWFNDGWSFRGMGLYDLNPKTGLGAGHGYGEHTDRDGNKYYFIWEGKSLKGGKYGTDYWEGTWKAIKGTGKFEGIHGKGTFQSYAIGDQAFDDWEGEVELPR